MSIMVGPYTFEGPFTTVDEFKEHPGLYAIHCYKDDRYYLIDVGQSATLKSCLAHHDRKTCWRHNCRNELSFAIHYTPALSEEERVRIEHVIRKQYITIPCGDVNE